MNPFIHLLQNPIITLTLAGYFIAMTTIGGLGLAYVVRKGTVLVVSTGREDRRMGNGLYGEWWGETWGGLIPPVGWIRDACKVAFASIVMVWALATVVYIATAGL